MDFDIKDLRDRLVADTEAKTLDFTTPEPGKGIVAVVPEGKHLQDLTGYLDKYLDKPRRRIGTAHHETFDSFTDHAKRFKAENSALFGSVKSETSATLTVIFDYHPGSPDHADTAFREHKGLYPFPFSDEWKLWMGQNSKPMDQADFAAFIEDHIGDVAYPFAGADPDTDTETEPLGKLSPAITAEPIIQDALLRLGGSLATPSKLVELSRGLAVHENAKVKQAVKLQTGEGTVQFETEHVGTDGAPLKIPGFFAINIPVFNRGEAVPVLVRLRYRLSGGSLVWFYDLYRPDLIVRSRVDAACEKAAKVTGIPLFMGTPE